MTLDLKGGGVWVVGQTLEESEEYSDKGWSLEGLWVDFSDAYDHAFNGGEDFWVSHMPINVALDPEPEVFSPVWWPKLESENGSIAIEMEHHRQEQRDNRGES